jgi:hypothetical protein
VFMVDGVCQAWGTDSLTQVNLVWADLTTRT